MQKKTEIFNPRNQMKRPSCLPDGSLLQGGKYRIVRFLGAGGFGCTYEAVFELLGERVAIKEFFPHELCNRDATGRMSVGTDSREEFVEKLRRKFVEEARTLFRYKDLEGVVKVTDVFEENGTSYFVMDYIDGQSLQKVIDSRGPLPEDEALRIISEVGHALSGVHARNCLHLDIKPDNIMLAADGHPVLIDFGVSKQYTREDGCNTSTLMGCTPGYAPIEQMKGNVRAFLPATDIYAFGATLYAMLSGKTPPDVSDLINETETLEFPPTVSAATRAAVEAAMQLKVKDRPATVAAFLALLPTGSPAPKPAPTPTPINPTKPIDPERRRKPNSLWIAIVAAVIAVVAVVAWRIAAFSTAEDTIAAADTTAIAADTVAVTPSTAEVPVTNLVAEGKPTEPTSGKTPVAQASEAAKPEKPQAAEPVQAAPVPEAAVSAPAASTRTETAMIAAYTDDGAYRAYTLSDWDGFSAAQRAKLQPVGVQLTASGRKFIVALTDAAGSQVVRWEDKDSYEDCVDIPGLRNIAYDGGNGKAVAKRDFNGKSNTNTILAYGRQNGIRYPAAEAAVNYSVKGHHIGWYLPAAGQLWLMYENKSAINEVLKKVNGTELSYYWSSTEEDSSYAWYVTMSNGNIYYYSKYYTNRVRAVAPVAEPREVEAM